MLIPMDIYVSKIKNNFINFHLFERNVLIIEKTDFTEIKKKITWYHFTLR